MAFFDEIGDFLFGEEGGVEQISALTPEQQQVMSSLLGVIQERLERPVSFAAEEALERFLGGVSPEESERRFREQQLPRLQRIFAEEVDPRVSEAFVQSGLRGSPRARARSAAAQQFGEFTSGQLAEEIRRGQELGLRALGAAPAITGLPIQAGLEFTRTPALAAFFDPGSSGILGSLFGGFGEVAGSAFGESLFRPPAAVPSISATI